MVLLRACPVCLRMYAGSWWSLQYRPASPQQRSRFTWCCCMRALSVCARMREVGACSAEQHPHSTHRLQGPDLGGTFACVPQRIRAYMREVGACSAELHSQGAYRPLGPDLGGTFACVPQRICAYTAEVGACSPEMQPHGPHRPRDPAPGGTFARVACRVHMREIGPCIDHTASLQHSFLK